MRGRRRWQRGQVMVVLAGGMAALLAVGALAIDLGLQELDGRRLAQAADAGALAGASNAPSRGQLRALQTAQLYAWSSLGRSAPADTLCTGASLTSPTCTVSSGGYTISVTNPYTAQDPIYLPAYTVAVDITHQNPAVAFSRVLGFTTFTIRAHAASTARSQSRPVPFALITRFLDVQGSSPAGSYGGVLVGQCSDGGVGDFIDHNVNGGIFFNGGTSVVAGAVKDVSGNYLNAQAVLVEDGRTGTCTGSNGNTNPDTSWSNLGDRVGLSATSTNASEWNDYYGFTSGPSGCSGTGSAGSCEASAVGDGSWQDPCWVSGNALVPVNSNTAYYQVGIGVVGNPSTVTCGSDSTGRTFEGSFTDSTWPGLPGIIDPATSLSLKTSTSGSGQALSSAGITPNTFYTSTSVSTSASLTFPSGWYVFQGAAASIALQNNSSFSCQAPTSGSSVPGCLFIFTQGAQLSMQSNSAAMNCSSQTSGYGNCAFEFPDEGPTQSTFSLTQGVNVSLMPIKDTQGSRTITFPVVSAFGASNCFNTPAACAVVLSQAGSFNVGGTFYAPHGIIDINANAAPLSGQVIADTVRLQGGSVTSGASISYRADLLAQAASLATLVEA